MGISINTIKTADKIKSDQSCIKLINIYTPFHLRFSSGYMSSISSLLNTEDAIIFGDLNTFYSLCFSSLNENVRGTNVFKEIDDSNFFYRNELQTMGTQFEFWKACEQFLTTLSYTNIMDIMYRHRNASSLKKMKNTTKRSKYSKVPKLKWRNGPEYLVLS